MAIHQNLANHFMESPPGQDAAEPGPGARQAGFRLPADGAIGSAGAARR
jgi:hypothetical protein